MQNQLKEQKKLTKFFSKFGMYLSWTLIFGIPVLITGRNFQIFRTNSLPFTTMANSAVKWRIFKFINN